MRILGIETSCDETAAAVVEGGTKVVSNITATSAQMHIKTGGIIPEQAARQQLKSILPVITETMNQASISPDKIDAISVTVGPGLIGSLLVGVETAKTLSLLWKKPLVPVNHLAAHLYANWLDNTLPEFPLVALVVSGGHTDLVYVKGHGKIKLLGTTRDDAAGECFDKCARLLGLPYPGGPEISKSADKYLEKNANTKLQMFPRPMMDEDNLDFSFSGLKTAVLNKTKGNKLKEEGVSLYSAEIQEAVADCLTEKTLRAVRGYSPKSLILGGGVAANNRLRQKLELRIKEEELKVKLFIPEPKLCTDNAAVIASCAYYNYKPSDWSGVSADPGLTIVS